MSLQVLWYDYNMCRVYQFLQTTSLQWRNMSVKASQITGNCVVQHLSSVSAKQQQQQQQKEKTEKFHIREGIHGSLGIPITKGPLYFGCLMMLLQYRYKKFRDMCHLLRYQHYGDVIMSVIASQITSLAIVFSTVYSGADQRKHQSSASLAFVRGIHRGPVNFPHKWPVPRKIISFDDAIMRHPARKKVTSIYYLK